MCHAHCDVSVARSLMCHTDYDVSVVRSLTCHGDYVVSVVRSLTCDGDYDMSVARSLREGVPDVSGETHQKEEDVGAEEHPAPGLQRGPGL